MKAVLTLAVLGLAGCAIPNGATTAVGVTISDAQRHAQAAIDAYGVAKGLAGIATMVNPTLVPVFSAVETVIDPQVAKAQEILNSGTTDAVAIEALATTISAQASAISAQAAPSVKVVPSATAPVSPVITLVPPVLPATP